MHDHAMLRLLAVTILGLVGCNSDSKATKGGALDALVADRPNAAETISTDLVADASNAGEGDSTDIATSDGGDGGPDSDAGRCCPMVAGFDCIGIGGSSRFGCPLVCDFRCAFNFRVERDETGCDVLRWEFRAPLPGENMACQPIPDAGVDS